MVLADNTAAGRNGSNRAQKRGRLEESVGNELRQHVGDAHHEPERTTGRLSAERLVEILDRLVAREAHTHLVLAGNPRIVARLRESLPKRLQDRLVDVIPVSSKASTSDVVRATLSSFAEHKETELLETAGLFLDELRTGGLAVAGTEAALEALARGQVEMLARNT